MDSEDTKNGDTLLPEVEDRLVRTHSARGSKCFRRKAVSNEPINPDDDEDLDPPATPIAAKTEEQRQRLAEAVKNVFVFKNLDREARGDVLNVMFERKVLAGEEIIRQGEDGDNFYVIDSGVFDIFVKDSENGQQRLVATHTNCGYFGELALMYNKPRSATVIAKTDGVLWTMDQHSFRRVVIKREAMRRKTYEKFLESVPILKWLDDDERMNVCDALVPQYYSDGEVIIKQGDQADGMFFIESGSVNITLTESDASEREISVCKTGSYLGELALVENKPRSANAYAVGPCKVAFLKKECFERLLGPCIEVMKRNMENYTLDHP